MQIARRLGANIVGSCSASGREEALAALGVGEVVDYRSFDTAPYRRSFDVVFDTAGYVMAPSAICSQAAA